MDDTGCNRRKVDASGCKWMQVDAIGFKWMQVFEWLKQDRSVCVYPFSRKVDQTEQIGWFPKTKVSVLANQLTVHSGGVSRRRVRGCGCMRCCYCGCGWGSCCGCDSGFYCFQWYYPHKSRDLVVSRLRDFCPCPL